MILVVDDDGDIRETICDILAEEGYTVAAARNGVEALSILGQPGHVCLILLDLMMPVMSGYQLLEERHGNPKLASVPVVVMSAHWDGRRGIDIADFVCKPPKLTSILAYAERYCGEERAQPPSSK